MDASKHLLIKLLSRAGLYRFNQSALRRILPALGLGYFGQLEDTGESLFLEGMLPRLSKRPVVLDVGANIGDYARAIMRLRPDAQLHVFEPNAGIFGDLVELGKTLGFTPHPYACGAAPAKAKLYVPMWNGHWATEKGTLTPAEAVAGVFDAELQWSEVEIVVLDDLLDAQGIDRVDYIKIDVQGHELSVLQGLRRRIESGRVDWISFEFDQGMVFTRTFMFDFYNLLKGYRFFRIVRNGLADLGDYRPDRWEVFICQNIVAVRPGISLDGMPVLK